MTGTECSECASLPGVRASEEPLRLFSRKPTTSLVSMEHSVNGCLRRSAAVRAQNMCVSASKMPNFFRILHFTSMTDRRSNDDQAVRALVERMVARVLSPEVGNSAEILSTIAQMQRRIEEQEVEICALKQQLCMQGQVPLADSVEDRLTSISAEVQTRASECERQLRNYVTSQVATVNKKVDLMATGERVAALERDVSRLKEAEQRSMTQFVYRPKELDGIIAFLTRQCGGNVGEMGVVDVLGSSYLAGDAKFRFQGVDLLSDSVFHTENVPGSWCSYDFKGRRVSLRS